MEQALKTRSFAFEKRAALLVVVAALHGAVLWALNPVNDFHELPPVTVAVKVVTPQPVPAPEPQAEPTQEPPPSAAMEAALSEPQPAPQTEPAVPPPNQAEATPEVNDAPSPAQIEPAPKLSEDTPPPPESPAPVIASQIPEARPVAPRGQQPSPEPVPAKPVQEKPLSKTRVAPVQKQAPPKPNPPKPMPEQKKPPARQVASVKSSSAREGKAEGHAAGSNISAAAYASLVVGQIQAHKFYPPGAAGASGTVNVVFTIGASGRVVSFSISRSSGSAALDRAASAAVHAIHLPPPPGGRFTGGTAIIFGR